MVLVSERRALYSFTYSFQLLKDDILPRVEKLKNDRNNYLEFQKIGHDIEVLERKLIAFDFYSSLVSFNIPASTVSNKLKGLV